MKSPSSRFLARFLGALTLMASWAGATPAEDCVYDSQQYPEFSRKVNSGKCQQCQKGDWIDVQEVNCPECRRTKTSISTRALSKPSVQVAASPAPRSGTCRDDGKEYGNYAVKLIRGACQRCENGTWVEMDESRHICTACEESRAKSHNRAGNTLLDSETTLKQRKW
jgi:hypothetical protein